MWNKNKSIIVKYVIIRILILLISNFNFFTMIKQKIGIRNMIFFQKIPVDFYEFRVQFLVRK